jgi:hypothetical protein
MYCVCIVLDWKFECLLISTLKGIAPIRMQRSTVTMKPRKGPFWRKQENAAKYGSRLRGWWPTQSDGNASQMPYVPNGIKGYTTTTTTTTTPPPPPLLLLLLLLLLPLLLLLLLLLLLHRRRRCYCYYYCCCCCRRRCCCCYCYYYTASAAAAAAAAATATTTTTTSQAKGAANDILFPWMSLWTRCVIFTTHRWVPSVTIKNTANAENHTQRGIANELCITPSNCDTGTNCALSRDAILIQLPALLLQQRPVRCHISRQLPYPSTAVTNSLLGTNKATHENYCFGSRQSKVK